MLDVVIVSWNTRCLLNHCLTSLERFAPSFPMTVTVVDNASHDLSVEMVRERHPTVRVVEAGSNLGYAAANNLGCAMATGEFVLFLNPDTEITQGALDTAVAKLRAREDCGALSAKLVSPDGSVQRSVRGFPNWLGILGDVLGLGRRFPGSKFDSYRLHSFDYDTESIVPQPMATFLLLKRSVLARIGDPAKPFDEQFPIFFNDVDLLKRLHDAGSKCLYCPDVVVVHHGGASTRQVRPAMIWESHRSLMRYFRKHTRNPLHRLLLPLLSAVVLAAAFIRARGYRVGFRTDH